MLGAEVNNERTILDYLNEDCWRAVLQYVPVQDLIRTERASRRWQEVVLTYLQEIRITIEEDDGRQKKTDANTCRLKQSSYGSFERWTRKLGLSVVAAYCHCLESLAVIKETCPNIEALKVVDNLEPSSPDILPTHNPDNFQFLQRVSFYRCFISDHYMTHFIADKALEELEFINCDNLTGLFFHKINLSNLKSLVIEFCKGLESKYMLPAIDRLGELTKLKVAYIPYELLEEMQLVMNKMPKLEQLELCDDIRMSCHSVEPLCRLTRLKHLRVSFQLADDVAEIARCCQELVTLDLPDCTGMTSASIEPLCRYLGARLTELSLSQFYEAEDDDVVALVRGCPNLTTLTVASTGMLTPALPARAAAARHEVSPGRPLRLDLSCTNLTDDCYLEEVEGQYEEMKTEYEDLILVL